MKRTCRLLVPVLSLAFTCLALAGVTPETIENKPWAPGDPIQLGSDKVILDFAVRGRFELRENTFDFNSAVKSPTDGDMFLERVRLGFTIRPTDWMTVRVQGQDAEEYGSERSDIPGVMGAEGDDPFELRLLSFKFGDEKTSPLVFEIGRQPLNYGDQRLIGAFEWNNIGRVFDAAVLRWKKDDNRVDLFSGSVVIPDRDNLNQSYFSGSGLEQILSGVYYTNSSLQCQTTDVYFLWQTMEGDTNFGTLGTRWASKSGALGAFDYGIEGALQAGDVTGKNLQSGAGHATFGYTWETAWKPRLALNYDYGSGDSDPTDGDVGTFQNLYPTNHLFYGYMDAFSWENMSSPSIEISAKPAKDWTVRAAYYAFWLATTDDAWYRANGVTKVRPITPSASSYTGSEIDLTVAWKPAKWAETLIGYTYFIAGDYLQDTGPASNAYFLYVQAGITF